MSRNRAAKLLSDPYAILRRPIMSEKSHDMYGEKTETDKKRYTFEVHVKANKHQIKKAIEAAFGVSIAGLSTMIVKPRKKAFRGKARVEGFTRIKKKAIIRLAKGSKQIELI